MFSKTNHRFHIFTLRKLSISICTFYKNLQSIQNVFKYYNKKNCKIYSTMKNDHCYGYKMVFKIPICDLFIKRNSTHLDTKDTHWKFDDMEKRKGTRKT